MSSTQTTVDWPSVFSFGRTHKIPHPNIYVQMLLGEYAPFAFDENRAIKNLGKWRKEIFLASEMTPIDLEIGTGNGLHFFHYASQNPDRLIVALELKYKPLIQTIRRPIRAGLRNARAIRFDAKAIDQVFAPEEINNVIIHFPDPWEAGPTWKHRLITDDFLLKLYKLQRTGSWVEFKTDSLNYFNWALKRFVRSPYELEIVATDLHRSGLVKNNFVTAFEQIFLRQGQPIFYLKAYKP